MTRRPRVQPGDLLDTEEVAGLLGVAPATVRAGRSRGYGPAGRLPPPIRLVSGRPVWERATVEEWMKGEK